ncbi:MipA/OmpV family protein [Parvularcula flava]|nr:MipA/OmpV family protein [Aquisalinus luteolus]NHK29318.1 MipA/OmpV family protein [Aquisalinus luteolus]
MAAFSAGQALAQTHPYEAVEEVRDWRVDVGGGGIYGFNPGGGASDQLNFTFWGSASYKDRIFANGLDGIGYNIVKQDRLRMGVALRPAYGAESELEGLELAEFGADLTAYAYQRLPGNVVIGGRIQRDVTDVSDGTSYFAQVSQQSITRVGLLNLTAYLSAGDANRNMTYLGITEEEAAATDYDFYDPGAGFTRGGVAALLAIPILDDYGVGGFVNYERAIDVAADSPLILDSKNEEDTFRYGIIFVRRFASDT